MQQECSLVLTNKQVECSQARVSCSDCAIDQPLLSDQELIDNAKSQLIGNYKALESLEQRSGTNVQSGTTETFQAFEAAIAEWDNKLGLPAKPSETLICSLTAHAAPVNATRNVAYEIAGAQDTNLNQALLTSVLQASS